MQLQDHVMGSAQSRTRWRRASLSEQPSTIHPTRRRRRRASDAQVTTQAFSAEHLANKIYRETRKSLHDDYIDIRRYTANLFSCLLPQERHNDDILRIYERWMECPLFVTDEELGKLFRITRSHSTSPRLAGTHSYYFRSYSMSCDELRQLLRYYEGRGQNFDKSTDWMISIQGQLASMPVTIRYVGKVGPHSTPYERAKSDLQLPRSSFALRDIHSSLEQILPHVAKTYRTYLINDLAVHYPTKRKPRVIIDMYERFLIAFFSRRYLMNRQEGGDAIDFVIPIEDEIAFGSLSVQFFHKFENSMAPRSAVTQNAVHELLQKIWQERENLDYTSGGASLFHSLVARSTPHTIEGFNIMAFIGEQITEDDYQSACTFLEGKSVTASLVIYFLSRLREFEQNRATFTGSKFSFFCFNNLFHQPGKNNSIRATEFLRQWCNIVKPLIIVTFGQTVLRVADKDFQSKFNESSMVLEEAGKARICHYTDETDFFAYPKALRDCATIVIPHLHPGRDARSRRSCAQRRVYLLTYMITLVYADTAMTIVQSCRTKDEDRESLCGRIIEVAESRLLLSGFQSLLQVAKRELEVIWLEEQMKPYSSKMTEESIAAPQAEMPDVTSVKTPAMKKPRQSFRRPDQVRKIAGEASSGFEVPDMKGDLHNELLSTRTSRSVMLRPMTVEKPSWRFNKRDFILGIFSGERAYGQPKSSERYQQIKKLWNADIPALHMHPDGCLNRQDSWLDFMSEQPEGYWFVGCVCAYAETISMDPTIRKLLLASKPPGYKMDEAWLQSFVARRTTLQNVCEAYSKRQRQWTQERSMGFRLTPVTAGRLNNRRVNINPQGKATMKWERGSGQVISVSVSVPKNAIPLAFCEERFICFTEAGIDIYDQDNTIFYHETKSTKATATLQKDLLCYNKSSPFLSLLWEEVTGLKCLPEGNSAMRVSDLSPLLPAGKPIIESATSLKLNPQNSPPQAGDALWLLNDFLNRCFPEGGAFWTGSVENFPEGTGDKDRFLAYLDGPQNVGHPYRQAWLDRLVHDTRHPGSCLNACIRFLRDDFETERSQRRPRVPDPNDPTKLIRGKMIGCSIYKMGPRRPGW